MMRYHNFLWLFVIFLCAKTLAAEDGRYSNYAFEPVYPAPDLADKKEKLILTKAKLLEWHELQRLEVLEIKPGTIWAAYQVGVKQSDLSAYAAYKDDVQYNQNRTLEPHERRTWTAVSLIDSKAGLSNLSFKRAKRDLADLWYPGIHWDNSYHCIDEKPLFKVNLIDSSVPSVVVVSAMRDQIGINRTGNSFIRLSIFDGETGSLQAEEYPLLWSARAVFDGGEEPKVSHYYMDHPGIWQRWYGIDWALGFGTGPDSSNKSIIEMEEESSGWIKSDWPKAAGRYQIGKLFAGDYDDDGRLELLFWYKRYRARNKTPPPEFFLESEFFTMYKEQFGANSFRKESLRAENGIELLKRKKQGWDDGWPQKKQGWDKIETGGRCGRNVLPAE